MRISNTRTCVDLLMTMIHQAFFCILQEYTCLDGFSGQEKKNKIRTLPNDEDGTDIDVDVACAGLLKPPGEGPLESTG